MNCPSPIMQHLKGAGGDTCSKNPQRRERHTAGRERIVGRTTAQVEAAVAKLIDLSH